MNEKLKEAVALTNDITGLEKELADLRKIRRELIIELRSEKVTARALSDALGMSEQNVHKIVKAK